MINKKGISIIVLIITIIVVIILAAVVILTLSKNNPIESAKEARFKEDVRTFQDELALYISKQYTNAGGHWDGSIIAESYNEIINYIPSFTKKYEGKFVINNNNLEYTNKLEEREREYAESLNINKKSILPDEYQQVEYIESTGTQFINTRVIGKSNLELYTSVFFVKLGNDECMIGSRNNNTRIYLLHVYNGRFCIGYGEFYNSNIVVSKKEVYNIYSSLFQGKQEFKQNEETIMLISNNGVCNTNLELYIFSLNYNRTPQYFSKIRLYNMRILDNGVLNRNFIPCYAKTTVTNVDGVQVSANTKGLYDTVEGKFYTNQGTGDDFIAGPDVNE